MKQIIELIKLMDTNGSLLITEQPREDGDLAMTLKGQIELDTIEISIHLSITSCIQAMLSRGGIVGVTIHAKVNGVSALFFSELTSKEKQEVGHVLCRIEDKKREALQANAIAKINDIIHPYHEN